MSQGKNKRRARKVGSELAEIVKDKTPETEPEMATCPKCHGTKIEEFNHGLLSRTCPECGGKGKVEATAKKE